MSEDPTRRYRALAAMATGAGNPVLHLIREDSEASLCGIPRAQLGAQDGAGGQFVCGECLDWLPKRVAFSGVHPRLDR